MSNETILVADDESNIVAGPGIPAADIPRIFERFYQIDKVESRPRRRSALGLAIVKEIVQAHDGSISVQ